MDSFVGHSLPNLITITRAERSAGVGAVKQQRLVAKTWERTFPPPPPRA